MERVLDAIDAWMLGVALAVQEYFTLGERALRFVAARPFYWRDTLIQMDRIGVGSLPILTLTGIFTGMVLALQTSVELSRFGAEVYLGSLVGQSMVRELGPVLSGLMLAGRAGSGIAAELGAMRVTEQIDAMEAMGTDPIKKLVTPRLLAGVTMLPLLTVVTDVVGVVGGLLVSVLRAGVPADVYLQGMWTSFALDGFIFGFFPRDFVMGLLKPAVFGAIVALTGSYCGLKATGGAEAVGVATTRAVVTSSILIIASDYFLTQLLLVVLPPVL